MAAASNFPVHLDGFKSSEVVETLISEELGGIADAIGCGWHPEHKRALDCKMVLRQSMEWPGRYSLRVLTAFGMDPEHIVSDSEVVITGFALRELRDKINAMLGD